MFVAQRAAVAFANKNGDGHTEFRLKLDFRVMVLEIKGETLARAAIVFS